MSQRLIDRNSDLKRLRDEGYTVEVQGSHLLVHNVPYATASRTVAFGTLISTLDLAGNRTQRPSTHVVHFIGEHPCHKDGSPISQIMHQSGRHVLTATLVVDRSFSNKPPEGYADYYHKMSTYAAIISGPAMALDPDVTPKSFIAIKSGDDDSVFEYVDTASSRAGIASVTDKLTSTKICIVGLGGTGSYILDLVAKTPVREIHLYDGDKLLQHNAFRSPGAPSLSQLEEAPYKVEYYSHQYGRLRRNIVPHPYFLDASNVAELEGADFVFVSMDAGEAKRDVILKLEELDIPFVDTGMGLEVVEGKLIGIVRCTASVPGRREHVWANNRISFSDADAGNEYSQNIQIADLNALNAALAVIKWKKVSGFYLDLENECHSTYTIDGNHLTNEDKNE